VQPATYRPVGHLRLPRFVPPVLSLTVEPGCRLTVDCRTNRPVIALRPRLPLADLVALRPLGMLSLPFRVLRPRLDCVDMKELGFADLGRWPSDRRSTPASMPVLLLLTDQCGELALASTVEARRTGTRR
jgi:hypothetical protein